jgi:predicted transcriptional regulator
MLMDGKAGKRRRGRPKLASTKQLVAIRLPPDLLARIDEYAEELRRTTPWASGTRAEAVRALLLAGLEAHDDRTQ